MVIGLVLSLAKFNRIVKLDPHTRTARVRVVLANQDLRLKPGMYATLRIVEPALRGLVSCPRDCLQKSVELREDGVSRRRPRERA